MAYDLDMARARLAGRNSAPAQTPAATDSAPGGFDLDAARARLAGQASPSPVSASPAMPVQSGPSVPVTASEPELPPLARREVQPPASAPYRRLRPLSAQPPTDTAAPIPPPPARPFTPETAPFPAPTPAPPAPDALTAQGYRPAPGGGWVRPQDDFSQTTIARLQHQTGEDLTPLPESPGLLERAGGALARGADLAARLGTAATIRQTYASSPGGAMLIPLPQADPRVSDPIERERQATRALAMQTPLGAYGEDVAMRREQATGELPPGRAGIEAQIGESGQDRAVLERLPSGWDKLPWGERLEAINAARAALDLPPGGGELLTRLGRKTPGDIRLGNALNVMGAGDMAGLARVEADRARAESGEVLSDADLAALARQARQSRDEARPGSIGYEAGQSVVNTVPFMVDMFLTGGTGTAAGLAARGATRTAGKAALRAAGRAGLEQSAARLAQSAAARTAARLGLRGAELAAGTAARLPAQLPGLAAQAAGTVLTPGAVSVEDGRATLADSGKDFWTEFTRAAATRYTETASEGLGALLPGRAAGRLAGRLAEKAAGKLAGESAGKFVSGLLRLGAGKGGPWLLKTRQTFRKAGLHGLASEWLEEDANTFMNYLVTQAGRAAGVEGLDLGEEAPLIYTRPDAARQLAVRGLALLAPQAGFMAARTVAKEEDRAAARKDWTGKAEGALARLGAPVGRKELFGVYDRLDKAPDEAARREIWTGFVLGRMKAAASATGASDAQELERAQAPDRLSYDGETWRAGLAGGAGAEFRRQMWMSAAGGGAGGPVLVVQDTRGARPRPATQDEADAYFEARTRAVRGGAETGAPVETAPTEPVAAETGAPPADSAPANNPESPDNSPPPYNAPEPPIEQTVGGRRVLWSRAGGGVWRGRTEEGDTFAAPPTQAARLESERTGRTVQPTGEAWQFEFETEDGPVTVWGAPGGEVWEEAPGDVPRQVTDADLLASYRAEAEARRFRRGLDVDAVDDPRVNLVGMAQARRERAGDGAQPVPTGPARVNPEVDTPSAALVPAVQSEPPAPTGQRRILTVSNAAGETYTIDRADAASVDWWERHGFRVVDEKTGQRAATGQSGQKEDGDAGSVDRRAAYRLSRDQEGTAGDEQDAGAQVRSVQASPQRAILNRAQGALGRSLGRTALLEEAPANKALAGFLDALGEAQGAPVLRVSATDEAGRNLPINGVFVGGAILIDKNAKDPAVVVALHEALHLLRRNAPDLYQTVIQTYSELRAAGSVNAEGERKFADRLQALRQRRGLDPLSPDILLEEMIADLSGDFAQSKAFWDRLYQKSPRAFQRLADYLARTVDRLLAGLKGKRPASKAAGMLFERNTRALEKMRRAVADALAAHGERLAEARGFVKPKRAAAAPSVKTGLDNMNGTQIASRLIAMGGLSHNLYAELAHLGAFEGQPEWRLKKLIPELDGREPGPLDYDDVAEMMIDVEPFQSLGRGEDGRPAMNTVLEYLAENMFVPLNTGRYASREMGVDREDEEYSRMLSAMSPEQRAEYEASFAAEGEDTGPTGDELPFSLRPEGQDDLFLGSTGRRAEAERGRPAVAGQGDLFAARETGKPASQQAGQPTAPTSPAAPELRNDQTVRPAPRPRASDPQQPSLFRPEAGQGIEPTSVVAREQAAKIGASDAPRDVPDMFGKDGRIEDFGEKLGGARKDRQPSMNVELTDADIAGKLLSEIWPKAEVDAIEEPRLAAIAHALRAEVPSKPRTSFKVRRWVETVKLVRELMRFAQDMGVEKFLERMEAPGRKLDNLAFKIRLLGALPREQWGRIGKAAYYPNAYRYENGKQVPSSYATAEVDGRPVSAADPEALFKLVAEKVGGETGAPAMQFEIRAGRDGVFINKKGDPLYRALKTFETVKEAREFATNNAAELTAAWEAIKESDNVKETDVRRVENRPRTGKDHRQGRDATPQMFMDAFGFRGVEFGNWVAQGADNKERQGMLNAAYDALMDLADIVGVPPRAMSLGGALGLGLGSRGSGWASAHFEPTRQVINLTKTRGAGALAHEWFHALDNYFQRQRDDQGQDLKSGENLSITYMPEPHYVHGPTRQRLSAVRYDDLLKRNAIRNPDEWRRVGGVRPEVEESFAELVKTLNASPMAKRSALIDKGKSGGYWSRILERAARAFENYVIARMQQQGFDNDYLANVTKVEAFLRDRGRYPYLLDEELEPVAEAFDNLFATIQTREEDGRTVLYSLADTPDQPDQPDTPAPLTTPEARAAKLKTRRAELSQKSDPAAVAEFENLTGLAAMARQRAATLKQVRAAAEKDLGETLPNTQRPASLVTAYGRRKAWKGADAREAEILSRHRGLIQDLTGAPLAPDEGPQSIAQALRTTRSLVNRAQSEASQTIERLKTATREERRKLIGLAVRDWMRYAEAQAEADPTRFEAAARRVLRAIAATELQMTDESGAALPEPRRVDAMRRALSSLMRDRDVNILLGAQRDSDVRHGWETFKREVERTIRKVYAGKLARLLASTDSRQLFVDQRRSINYAAEWERETAPFEQGVAAAKRLRNARAYLAKMRKESRKTPAELAEIEQRIEDYKRKLESDLGGDPRLDTARMIELHDTLDSLKRLSRVGQSMALERRSERVKNYAQAVAEEVREALPRADAEQARKNPLARWAVDRAGSLESIVNTMGGLKIGSTARRVLFEAFRAGQDKAGGMAAEAMRLLEAAMKENSITWDNFDQWAAQTFEVSFEAPGGRRVTHVYTYNQAMNLYALLGDAEAMATLRRNGLKPEGKKYVYALPGDYDSWANEIASKDVPAGFDFDALLDQVLGDIIQKLTPAQKNVIGAMKRILAGMAEEGNKTSERIGGRDRFFDPEHWRLAVDRGEVEANDPAALAAVKGFGPKSLMQAGFLKERTPHRHPVVIEDVIGAFSEQVRNLADFTHLAEPMLEALNVLGDERVMTQMNSRLGNEVAEALRDIYAEAAHMGGHKAKLGTIDNISSRWAVYTLAWRPTSYLANLVPGGIMLANWTAANQPQAAAGLAAELARQWGKGAATFAGAVSARDKAEVEKLQALSGYLAERWQLELARAVANLQVAGTPKERGKLLLERRRASKALRHMARAEQAIALALYRALKASGMNESEAAGQVAEAIRQTQNPSTALEETRLYRAIKGNSALNALVPMQGQPTVAANYVLKELQKLGAAETGSEKLKAGKDLARTLAAFAAAAAATTVIRTATRAVSKAGIAGAAGLGLGLLGLAGGDDEDEKRKTAARVREDWADEFGGSLVPLVGDIAARNLMRGANIVLKAAQDGEDVTPALAKVVPTLANLDNDFKLGWGMPYKAGSGLKALGDWIVSDKKWSENRYLFEKTVISIAEVSLAWRGVPAGGVVQIGKAGAGLVNYPLGEEREE